MMSNDFIEAHNKFIEMTRKREGARNVTVDGKRTCFSAAEALIFDYPTRESLTGRDVIDETEECSKNVYGELDAEFDDDDSSVTLYSDEDYYPTRLLRDCDDNTRITRVNISLYETQPIIPILRFVSRTMSTTEGSAVVFVSLSTDEKSETTRQGEVTLRPRAFYATPNEFGLIDIGLPMLSVNSTQAPIVREFASIPRERFEVADDIQERLTTTLDGIIRGMFLEGKLDAFKCPVC